MMTLDDVVVPILWHRPYSEAWTEQNNLFVIFGSITSFSVRASLPLASSPSLRGAYILPHHPLS